MEIGKRLRTIVKIDRVNPYVDVPRRVGDALGRAVLVRVRAAGKAGKPLSPSTVERLARIGRFTQNGWFRTTIVRRKGLPMRLYLDAWMRRSSGAETGDSVTVHMRPDDASRALLVPAKLRRALARNTAAKKRWEALPPSRRREMLSYLNFLESREAVKRTVKKILSRLGA